MTRFYKSITKNSKEHKHITKLLKQNNLVFYDCVITDKNNKDKIIICRSTKHKKDQDYSKLQVTLLDSLKFTDCNKELYKILNTERWYND